MGSSTSSLSSTTAPITFNGSSTYSSSFQQVLNRAVSIASLPLQSLQNEVSTFTSQSSELSTLNGDFASLQSSVQSLGTAAGGTPTAQVSDSSSIQATATAGALDGTYTIQVVNPGSSTTTLSEDSLPTVTDPTTQNISSSSSFTLTVDGVSDVITPSGSSLEDLATAINGAGDGVQATIVNVGSGSSPDYRLAVTSNNLGQDTIKLSDSSQQPLLSQLTLGSPALYSVNGSTTQLESNSSEVTLSPGLTVDLIQATASPVTVTVSTDYSGVQTAISSFVTAYNQAVSDLSQNRGQAGGALTGDSMVYTLTDVLSGISQYSASAGSVSTLADLGLTLNASGQMQFDSSTFAAANPTDMTTFLGNIDSSGFLDTANNNLTSVTDSTTGLIPTDINSLEGQITATNSQITDQQNTISNLETNLQAQLSQADAAIATLQAQQTYFTELFTAEYGSPTPSTA